MCKDNENKYKNQKPIKNRIFRLFPQKDKYPDQKKHRNNKEEIENVRIHFIE